MILTERVKLLQNVILQRVFMRCSCMLQNRRNAKPTVFAKRGMQSFAYAKLGLATNVHATHLLCRCRTTFCNRPGYDL